MIALQVAQQSPLTYLQKFASQPVPQLPTPQVVQQQFLPASAQQGSTSGSKQAGQSQQNGSKGSLDTAPGAGAHKALQLPLLRPAPPVLKPFAGIQTAYCFACCILERAITAWTVADARAVADAWAVSTGNICSSHITAWITTMSSQLF